MVKLAFAPCLALAFALEVAVTDGRLAHADAAADQALADVDAHVNAAKSLYLEYDVLDQEPGKAERHLAFKVWLKGDARLTEITAPPDMKGTKVLVLSPTQMYVYLPSFGKIRRIASSVTEQGFLGLTYSQDDFAPRYAPLYTATFAAGDDEHDKLVLQPRPGAATPYGKLELTYLKDKKVPSEIRYYGGNGEHLKTEVRSGYTCEADQCTPSELKMTESKGGHFSAMTRKALKVNPGLSDDLFSKRSLGE
jgi:outer membrane lipoprotein-sorting protein